MLKRKRYPTVPKKVKQLRVEESTDSVLMGQDVMELTKTNSKKDGKETQLLGDSQASERVDESVLIEKVQSSKYTIKIRGNTKKKKSYMDVTQEFS